MSWLSSSTDVLRSQPALVTGIALAVSSVFVLALAMNLFTPSWSPAGKHILVTGGSQGLGLALAKLLASKGASVTICSRSQAKLDAALLEVKQASKPPSSKVKGVAAGFKQVHRAISADLSSFDGAKHALDECVNGAEGSVPDVVFCCAGGSKPGYFIEQTEQDFEAGVKTDYWTALGTAHAAANVMVRAPPSPSGPRKIVLVSSVLGFFGLVGYSQYTPMKHAIRGLAESLRSELLLYGIDVHAYFPSTILSPGFEIENQTKPAITREIEGVDEGLTPEACAAGLLAGVQKGHFMITTDFLAELFRTTNSGASAPGNGVLDGVLRVIGLIGLPIWRILGADRSVRAYRSRHAKEINLSIPPAASS